jgi:heme oxygenase
MLAGVTDDLRDGGRSYSNLRDRLRDATAEAHRDLDAQLSAFDLTEFSGYSRFLGASAAALLPLEAALVEAGVADLFADWPSRSRSAAIASDLASLGRMAPSGIRVSALNRNEVLGTMYVLEGSRLGAGFLLKTIADASDVRIRETTAYLAHGAGKGLWRSFLSRLAEARLTAQDEAEAIAAARAAFAVFERAADRA